MCVKRKPSNSFVNGRLIKAIFTLRISKLIIRKIFCTAAIDANPFIIRGVM